MANNNAGYIISAIQIVVGVILVATGNPAGVTLIISGALSMAGTALAPRPTGGGGIESSTTYGSNLRAIAAEGAPKKIVLGRMRIQPEIISMRTESTGEKETVFILGHCGSGGDYGIESITDPELNNNKLDHFGDSVEFDYRLGTSGQTGMKGFDQTSIAYSVAETLPDTAWTYVTKGAVDSVSIVLVWYGGLYKVSKSGLEGVTWMAEVDYQVKGRSSWTKVLPTSGAEDGWSNSIQWGRGHGFGSGWITYGQTTGVVRRIIHIDFPTKAVHTIRINPYKSYSDETYKRTAVVDRVEEITDDGNTYPGEALIGLKYVVTEQLSGTLPKFTCVVKGWKVKNLGDSVAAWTQNPAKLLLAVLTNEEIGSGRYFTDSMFDTGVGGSWRTAESYFDAQVVKRTSKGRSSYEDRMHLDLVLDAIQNADEWVAHILDLCRSQLIDWGEDGIRMISDKAGTSVATFDGRQARSSANRPILRTDDGRIDLIEHEIETDKRTTHLRGIYWDEDDNFARRFTDELVDPDYVVGDPRVTSELFMPGVTRQSQALRQCRYRINVDRLRTLVYEFGIGIGDLNVLPMDVVTVYADSPPLAGVTMMIVGTSYDQDPTRGRVAAVIYDAGVYADSTDELQKKAPSLSRAKALKNANTTPAGVSNIKLSEVVGSSHLQCVWDSQPDANRRFLRVYVSRVDGLKGELAAEIDASTKAYLIRNVSEGSYYVYVVAVGRGGTEENWTTTQGSASILISRQKVKPAALTNVAAQNIGQAVTKAVAFDPPASGDVTQDVEVIKGSDEYTGQIVGTVTAERAGTTGDQGTRTVSIPLPSQTGRGTGNESIVVRGVTPGGKAGGPSTTLAVPFLNLPNHSQTVLASISGTTLVGFPAAATSSAWEYEATDGARLRAVPIASAATSANGWGNAGTGLLADNPAGAQYIVTGTITSSELDIGSGKTFLLECYDEVQRKAAAAVVTAAQARWPAGPSALERLETYAYGPMWAARLLDGALRPVRPLAPTYWEFRFSLSTPVTGDWAPLLPNSLIHARYLQVRFTMTDLLGLHRVICPRVYVRAWVPLSDPGVSAPSGSYNVADLDKVVLVDTTATITLPSAITNAGRLIRIKSVDAGAIVTVNAVAGNLDGLSDQVLGGTEAITVISSGTDWWII